MSKQYECTMCGRCETKEDDGFKKNMYFCKDCANSDGVKPLIDMVRKSPTDSNRQLFVKKIDELKEGIKDE